MRDLGVLALRVHASRLSSPARVLDACSGSGIRSLRYIREAHAGIVWANDAQTQDSSVLGENLAEEVAAGTANVTVQDMRSVCAEAAAGSAEARFDLVDLDVFGACTLEEIRMAMSAVCETGGLMYLSSTDSTTAAGHNAAAAKAAWEAELVSHPAVNEQFLRVVAGAAARVARESGLEIKPVFSFFHSVSSTARVMVRVKKVRAPETVPKGEGSDIGFLAICGKCGQHGTVREEDAENAVCGGCGCGIGEDFKLSGPVWTGRMHNVETLREMRALARSEEDAVWKEAERATTKMINEGETPPLYYGLGDLAKRIGMSAPPRQRIFDELANRGHKASAAHCRPKVIKTSASLAELTDVARSCADDVVAMHAAAASSAK